MSDSSLNNSSDPVFEGVVFLCGVDGSLGYRSKQYLDTDNPAFFSDNYTSVEKAWLVTSKNYSTVFRMIQEWKVLQVDAKLAECLLLQLGLTRDILKVKKSEVGL